MNEDKEIECKSCGIFHDANDEWCSQKREEVECKSLLAKRSANELRVYSKKSIESEERINKMIQDRKNDKFVKDVTESFSIISS